MTVVPSTLAAMRSPEASPRARRSFRLRSTRAAWPARPGSRIRNSTSSGVAIRIEEMVETIMPMNSARAMSRRVPAPRRKTPTKRIAATGSTPTTEVLMDRTRVWFTARLAASS